MRSEGSVNVWYHVRNLDAARAFYTQKLGFTEAFLNDDDRWAKLERGAMQVALAEGDPQEGGVAAVDVDDVRKEAERLRTEGVEVGVVLEIHDEVRLVDVYDPDGNRIQLVEQIAR